MMIDLLALAAVICWAVCLGYWAGPLVRETIPDAAVPDGKATFDLCVNIYLNDSDGIEAAMRALAAERQKGT